MKKWLFLSLMVNGLFLFGGVYYYFKSQSKEEPERVMTNSVFSNSFAENDILFIGEERMQICNWRVLLNYCEVSNVSKCNFTIEKEIIRLPYLFTNIRPKQVVVMLGLTDLNQGIPVNEVYENYVTFLEQLKEMMPEVEVVIVSLLPVDPAGDHYYKNVSADDLEAFNLLVKVYAMHKGLPYVNLYDDFKMPDKTINPNWRLMDGFHLSEAGYGILKNRLMPYLQINR